MNNRSAGAKGEELAEEYLTQHGVRILDRNFHFHKLGEIDLIGETCEEYIPGKKMSVLVFIEVKKRTSGLCGTGAQAVGSAKQRTIGKVARAYLMEKHIPQDRCIRFDVVSIDGSRVSWIKNAFEYRQ